MRSRLLSVLAALGLVASVVFAWVRLWSIPIDARSAFGLDLGAYREAAIRLIATGSPYHEALLSGPIENRYENVSIAYLYPPPIAQVFVPVVDVDPQVLAAVWATLQAVALLAVMPLVYRRYGGTLTLTSTLTIWIALVLSFPLNFALYVGNLSGWIAIAIAVMLLAPGRAAGVASALLSVVKMTPAVLLLPAVIRRESRSAALVTIAVVTTVSLVLAPYAWSQWFRVLPNIVRFPPATSTGNLAPVGVLGALGFPTAGVVLGLAITVVAVVASIALAYRGSWAGAVAAATTALLFAPSTIWNHYLVVTLPILIAAWPHSDWRMRVPIVLFMAISAIEWLGFVATPGARTAYLAATILVTGLATAWLASREPGPVAAEAAPA